MTTDEAGVPVGTYLVHLCAAHWHGVRPLHEVWTATVDIATSRLVPDLGDRLMAAVASARLRPARAVRSLDLQPAVEISSDALAVRHLATEQRMRTENNAFLATRQLSAKQVHQRRIASIKDRIHTLNARGGSKMVPLFEAQLKREDARHAAFAQDIASKSTALLATEDLAICVVEVS